MGTNPSAKLFFGYVWGEDGPDGEDTVNAQVAALVRAAGVADPWDEFDRAAHLGDQPAHADFAAAHRAEIDAWRDATAAARKEVGVDWGLHGSEYDMRHHLYALGSLHQVEWSDTEEITPLTLNVVGQDLWRQKLDRYLAAAEIEKPEGVTSPSWHLACLYF